MASATPSKQTLFLTGATGYVGGFFLWRFLRHKSAKNYHIKVLVRDPRKANLLEKFGVQVVVGSLSDLDVLEHLASEADFIFNAATSDDLEAIQAILRGAKKHKEISGKAPFFIQTSGTGVLKDNAAGMYANDKVYDDAKLEDIESLPPTQPHRLVDITVTAADSEGYVKTYIVIPSTIYAIATTGFTDAKIQNTHSIQTPAVIRAGLDRGQGGMVGLGKNKWGNVHIEDLIDFYVILFENIIDNPGGTPHGREGYYFASADEHLLYDSCKAIAEALVALGKGTSPEPTSFSQEEVEKYIGVEYEYDWIGCNSRCVSHKAQALGWIPTKTTADFLASICPEVEAIIAEESK